jgi:IS605 OrfB family transposase
LIRSIKVSLGNATQRKMTAIVALLREYRAATNFYINSLWETRGAFDAATLNKYTDGSLGYRQKSDALAMALETISATKKASAVTGHLCGKPRLRGAFRVSSLCAKVEPFKCAGFDFAIKLSGLIKGKPITVPIKAHKQLNYWLTKPGAVLKSGCVLHEKYIALYIELPDKPERVVGKDLGVDTGYRKLLASSAGEFHGTRLQEVCARVRRAKPGSKGKRCACAAREQYINKAVKELPWTDLRMLAVEDLTGLKLKIQQKGKSSKKSRKTMAPWTYRQALSRIEQLAQENRVRLVYVNPRDTSRRCPACGWVAKENRVAENFRCVRCNHSADADTVGAVNILARVTGNWQDSMVPASSKV